MAEPDTDSPISDIPGIPVAWPEDIEIPALEPLEPEGDIRFADLLEDAPRIAFDEADLETLSNTLVLGFPQKEPPFTAARRFRRSVRGIVHDRGTG